METKGRLALVAALVAILVALAGLAVLWWSVSRPGAPGNDQVQLAPVRTGLPWPIALAFSPDGRVFFAERFSGRIQVLGNTTILDSTFFAIPEIASSGEQGLLGLAVDPNFPNRPYVYVYYTRDDAANGTDREARSEEHTSELQSRLHLVCRLLLEKKKVRYAVEYYQVQPDLL